MRTTELKVYKFDELPEDVQEKVVNEWRHDDYYPWGDELRDTLTEFEKNYPVKITEWEYGGGRAGGIYFNFTEEDEIASLKGVRLLKYLQNNNYIPEKDCPFTAEMVKEPCQIIHVHTKGQLLGVCFDENILDPLRAFIEKPSEDIDFYQLMRDCLHSWLDAAEKDYEYWLSEESIKEEIEANEYEFTADGKIYRGDSVE